ncbi:hypothetical protein DERP_009227 [Dermatophagoides pteronyssinus]|uniref:Uncharacterized protein n=1 Tax=Dermatophagoides pteronyssinus TaxID=6956 RepID=A0ABQ8JQV8_DERPT|nr:hypothetical protein DERP_009227 [Dermatophagoides pteronyssinus]
MDILYNVFSSTINTKFFVLDTSIKSIPCERKNSSYRCNLLSRLLNRISKLPVIGNFGIMSLTQAR